MIPPPAALSTLVLLSILLTSSLLQLNPPPRLQPAEAANTAVNVGLLVDPFQPNYFDFPSRRFGTESFARSFNSGWFQVQRWTIHGFIMLKKRIKRCALHVALLLKKKEFKS